MLLDDPPTKVRHGKVLTVPASEGIRRPNWMRPEHPKTFGVVVVREGWRELSLVLRAQAEMLSQSPAFPFLGDKRKEGSSGWA